MAKLSLIYLIVCGGLWDAESARIKVGHRVDTKESSGTKESSSGRRRKRGRYQYDPFGSMLPPMHHNPMYTHANRYQQEHPEFPNYVSQFEAEERLLMSETLFDQQVELNQEERMQVQCVGMEHLREVTDYIPEQTEMNQQIGSLRHFNPTEAEHWCLPLHRRNKKMPRKLFADTWGFVNVPAFPERLGEIVIDAVHHTDATPKGSHIVLQMKGCTSCDNDWEDFVEWGGLLAIDESGSYRKMYTASRQDNFGAIHWNMGDRTNIVFAPERQSRYQYGRRYGKGLQYQQYPRRWTNDLYKVPRQQQKFLKQYEYKYSSYRFDEFILPDVQKMAQASLQSNGSNGMTAGFVHQHQSDEIKILHELREQEKHLPFNHKLEQVWMDVYVCQEVQGGGLRCPPKPAESLIMHDGALMFDSADTALFDQLGESAGQCTFGNCMTARGRLGQMSDGTPLTMCSGCTSQKCGHQTRAYPPWSQRQEGHFNCLVERMYEPGRAEDLLLQKGDGGMNQTEGFGSGLFFRKASGSVGHVEGHINWHLSVPRAGHCQPFLQDVAYIGIGVDECDKCRRDAGAVDIDIGLLLLSCNQDPNSKSLGNAGQCAYYDHQNYAHRRPKNNFYAISEDDRGGDGEGDDEWAFLNLAELAKMGVTHAVVLANIFGCASHTAQIGWQDLEGAFARVTGSSRASKDFENAETISYIDLDGMTGPAKNGAALLMFYLSDDINLAEPEKMQRSDAAAGSGRHWKMVVAKAPFQGRTMASGWRELANFGLQIIGHEENGAHYQVEHMELPTLMGTGQTSGPTTELMPELTPVLLGSMEDANSYHPSGETKSGRHAKEMDNVDLWKKLAITLPGGAPGTDSICAATHTGPRK
jgi:stress response protein SCP2